MAAAVQTKGSSDGGLATHIDIPLSVPLPARTVSDDAKPSANLAAASPGRSTTDSLQSRTRGSLVWSAPASPATAHAATPPVVKSDGAKGVLLHINDESAQCEFLHGQSSTKVWLPRSLFPSGAKPGFTFSLSVDTEGGFRSPRITPRKPEADVQIEERLARVLEQLGE